MQLTFCAFLVEPFNSSSRGINEITLAAVLQDKDMLEHLMERYLEYEINTEVALSGNLKVLQWINGKKNSGMGLNTFSLVACSGSLEMVNNLH